MKLTNIAIFALGAALASGQGLYNISNLYALDEETSPLTYTASLTFGYDDNTQPVGSEFYGETASSYLQGMIGAGFAENNSNYSLSAYANLGFIYYLDDEASLDDLSFIATAGLDFTYQFNERVRYSTRNYVNRGFEPDYDRGLANDRRAGLYTSYYTNHDIGIRWSDRLATVHGISFSGSEYDEFEGFSTTQFYNDIRYSLSPRTTLIANYRYGWNERSNSQTVSAGIEHAFTERTGFQVRGGYTSLENNDTDFNSDSPYLHASVNHKATDRFSLRGFVSYTQDDNFVAVPMAFVTPESGNTYLFRPQYGSRENLRLGFSGDYTLSEKVALHGGVSYYHSNYEGLVSDSLGIAPDDLNAGIYNINAGFSYAVNPTFSVTGNYNFSDSFSDDTPFFDYTRNRYSIGIQASF